MARSSGTGGDQPASVSLHSRLTSAMGVGKDGTDEYFFEVNGAIPRKLPYKQGRFGPYVPTDVKVWRKTLAEAFQRVGRAPKKGESVFVVVVVYMKKNHADLDSCYHSIQDALSKDAWHVVDKHWQHAIVLGGIVPPDKERVYIGVFYA